MQEWMRKHRRLIMFFILVFIGVPMVIFFGMPSGAPNRDAGQDNVIARVGNVPITESQFRRRLDAMAEQRANQQQTGRPSYRELDEDGTVQRVVEQMIDAALITMKAEERSLNVDESLLAKQMQDWDWFKDENGNFKRDAWNEWVSNVSNWDDIYDELRGEISREVFLGAVTAPAGRVRKDKIDEELLAEQTQMRVRYAQVEIALDISDEEIQAHYDENPDEYREPEVYMAEFVAIPIIPDVPELAWELILRARDGEDFAELANEYSDQKEPEGGAMNWRREGSFVSDHLKPFFALEVGEISEPVLGPTGYHIYLVEEERFNEVANEWEVRGRQIVLNTELDPEILEERKRLAHEIAAKMQATDDPAAVAEEYGLEILQTDYYNRWKMEIENITATRDMYRFRGRSLDEDYPPWEPIEAILHIFLANIIDTQPGDLPPLEEVRDDVIENITNERKRTEEYQEELAERIEAIEGQVVSLDAITELDPKLSVEIAETEEMFSRRDSLFQQEIYVQTRDIFAALKDKEEGEIGGPVPGLLGGYWFFELAEREAPTPEELAELDEEREELKERLVRTAQFEILADYAKDLRERMMASISYTQDAEAFDRILGRGLEWEGETDAETTALDDALAGEGEPAVDDETADDEDGAASDDADDAPDADNETAAEAAALSDESVVVDETDETALVEDDEATEIVGENDGVVADETEAASDVADETIEETDIADDADAPDAEE